MEYAIERRILETPVLDMSYYADVAGDVPSSQEQAKSVSWEPFDIGNGDVAPEWGFDIIVRGGFLRYGPWADRQRFEVVDFQICHVSLIVVQCGTAANAFPRCISRYRTDTTAQDWRQEALDVSQDLC